MRRNTKPLQRVENVIYKRTKIRVICNAAWLGLTVTFNFTGKVMQF